MIYVTDWWTISTICYKAYNVVLKNCYKSICSEFQIGLSKPRIPSCVRYFSLLYFCIFDAVVLISGFVFVFCLYYCLLVCGMCLLLGLLCKGLFFCSLWKYVASTCSCVFAKVYRTKKNIDLLEVREAHFVSIYLLYNGSYKKTNNL